MVAGQLHTPIVHYNTLIVCCVGGSKAPPVLFIPVMYGQMYSAYGTSGAMTFHIVQEASNVRRYS